MKDVQISGFVSQDVRDDFERLVKARGLKKGHVLEQALRHHLRALREIPAEFIIPASVVLTRASFERLLRQLKSRSRPTPMLRRLMKGLPVSEDGLY